MKDLLRTLDGLHGSLENQLSNAEVYEKNLESLKSERKAFSDVKKCLEMAYEDFVYLDKDIKGYLVKKEAEIKLAFDNAIRVANNIVPASNSNIVLNIKEGKAGFITPEEFGIDSTEGSGYRGVLSLLMRTIVYSMHNSDDFIILSDEILSKLSPESSAILSPYLKYLFNNKQLLAIEQKAEVFEDSGAKVYYLSYDDDGSILTER